MDAMGNVFVVDTGNTRIVRLTTAGVASALSISGMPAPSTLGSTLFGTTLDPLGNLYIPDWTNNRIVLANVSGATLAFPNTNVGSISATRTATVANLGDLPLIFATVPSYTVNFSEDSGDENLCALGTSLAAGTLCDVAIEFTPQSAGSLSTGIVVTDNSLNLTATTQDLAVSGTGIAVADSTAVAVSTAPTSVVLGQAITIAAIVTDTTAGHAATIPTGGVTFMDTVGSTTISLNGGTAVALNGSGTAILAGVTLAGVGTHTITANYVGVAGVFATSSNTTTIPVAAAPIVPTINWTPPSGAIPYGTTLSGILDASATSGSTTVAGSFTYTATHKNSEGEKIKLTANYTETDEARDIAETCKDLIKRGTRPREIAVLYRANFQSRVLEESFLKKEVPYQVLGVRFFERKEVKDVLSFIRASLNRESAADLVRIINVPPRGIGKATMMKVLAHDSVQD